MDTVQEKKSFNKRAFISIVLFTAGLILPVSGIMNHNLQFDPLTSERHFWMAVHNMSALLFGVFAVLHISLNWRVLIHYAQKVKSISVSKEAFAAVTLVLCLVGLFSLHAFHVR